MIQFLMRKDRLQDLQNQIMGSGSEIYVQRPTFPQSGKRPQQKTFVALGFLVTFFILLIFIFLRLAWVNYSVNPKNAEKMKHIRRSQGMAV
jgi:flagellar biogenesis protein FliO